MSTTMLTEKLRAELDSARRRIIELESHNELLKRRITAVVYASGKLINHCRQWVENREDPAASGVFLGSLDQVHAELRDAKAMTIPPVIADGG